MSSQNRPEIGKVYLVGAGPGALGLFTLRGKECLEKADVVIYDYLANPELLDFTSAPELVCLGNHRSGRVIPQSEINQMIVDYALQGKQVVRLKGGDPAIFARTHEELQLIREHQIPFEIVPGITAALAVTGTVGIPLTHRDFASAVAFVTGQEKSVSGGENANDVGSVDSQIDYAALAKFPGTLVFYMGTTTVDRWSSELQRAGMDGDTPVVAVRNCSHPHQESFQCRLDEIVSRVNQNQKLRPPVLFVVGKAAAEFGKYNWFESRPLFGKTILVTRPEHQAAGLCRQFQELGATVIRHPAITIDRRELDVTDETILEGLDRFDWIVFSSVNGVEHFMNRLLERGDARRIANAKIAAIGPATSQRLAEFHLRADLVPATYEASVLAEELAPLVNGKSVLLIRASRGREVLRDQLQSAGAEITQLVCYNSNDNVECDEAVRGKLFAGEVDYVTVTSSAIARSLHATFGDELAKSRLVSISPITTGTLSECGQSASVEATDYCMDGIIAAVLRDLESK